MAQITSSSEALLFYDWDRNAFTELPIHRETCQPIENSTIND